MATNIYAQNYTSSGNWSYVGGSLPGIWTGLGSGYLAADPVSPNIFTTTTLPAAAIPTGSEIVSVQLVVAPGYGTVTFEIGNGTIGYVWTVHGHAGAPSTLYYLTQASAPDGAWKAEHFNGGYSLHFRLSSATAGMWVDVFYVAVAWNPPAGGFAYEAS